MFSYVTLFAYVIHYLVIEMQIASFIYVYNKVSASIEIVTHFISMPNIHFVQHLVINVCSCLSISLE